MASTYESERSRSFHELAIVTRVLAGETPDEIIAFYRAAGDAAMQDARQRPSYGASGSCPGGFDSH